MKEYTFEEMVAAYKAAEEELARWKREFCVIEVWEPFDGFLQEHLGDWLVAHGAIYNGWVAHESYCGYGYEYFVPASLVDTWEAYKKQLVNEVGDLEPELDLWAK